MLHVMVAVMFAGMQPTYSLQETAARVTGKLPATASCFIWLQNGETELENPARAVTYKGKT